MMPRSSRSHSTHVPGREHDGLDAPGDVSGALPGDDGEGARPAASGEAGPQRRPRTGRACRRCRTWPWPARAGCSPGRRATPAGRRRCRRSTGAPSRAPASPTAPDESTMAGQDAAGDAQRLEHGVVPVRAVAGQQPGDAGVGGVGDVQGAVRQRPRHPGVDGAEAQVAGAVGIGQVEEHGELGGRLVGRHPDALVPQHQARPHRAQVLPADARARRARRWRGPTRWSRPAGWRCRRPSTVPAAASAGAGHLEHGAGHGARRRTRRSPARATRAAPRCSGRGRWRRRVAPRRRARPRCPRRRRGSPRHGQRAPRTATAGRACPG